MCFALLYLTDKIKKTIQLDFWAAAEAHYFPTMLCPSDMGNLLTAGKQAHWFHVKLPILSRVLSADVTRKMSTWYQKTIFLFLKNGIIRPELWVSNRASGGRDSFVFTELRRHVVVYVRRHLVYGRHVLENVYILQYKQDQRHRTHAISF